MGKTDRKARSPLAELKSQRLEDFGHTHSTRVEETKISKALTFLVTSSSCVHAGSKPVGGPSCCDIPTDAYGCGLKRNVGQLESHSGRKQPYRISFDVKKDTDKMSSGDFFSDRNKWDESCVVKPVPKK